MKFFVTGSTGFIGSKLCGRLLTDGHEVVALYRSENRLKDLPSEWFGNGLQKFKGDLSDPEQLANAMAGCNGCFHLAALARAWTKKHEDFHKTNVVGTRNVFNAAVKAGVPRLVFTSTASVYGPSDQPIDESHPLADKLDSLYERSKRDCEAIISSFRNEDLDIITVYPSRVYGPGSLSVSNALTRIFSRYLSKRWHFIPTNGSAIGNYVFVDDVVEGHYLAMQKSTSNQNYLLGGDNLSFNQITSHLNQHLSSPPRLWKIPKSVLMIVGYLQLMRATVFGTPPQITPAFVNKYLKNWLINSDKAVELLGYRPMAFKEGLDTTIKWLAESESEV